MILSSSCCSINLQRLQYKIKETQILVISKNYQKSCQHQGLKTIIDILLFDQLYNIEEVMLKKIRKSQICLHEANLMGIVNNPKNHMKREDIMQLFTPQHRQVFELDYLYKSPHFKEYPAYCQLIRLLENFNQQTVALRNSNSITNQINNFNRTKLACIRLIYREMLSISNMTGWQIKQGDLATKLKNWYYSLMNRHSFLEGVNIKRRNQNKEQQNLIEKDIRSKYMSNVYDQINDYLRKKFDYISNIEKENFNDQINQKGKKQLNLPYIDTLIYKRQDARMRQHRQKQIEQNYLSIMIKNKQKLRETSLMRAKNNCNIRQKIAITEHRQQSHEKINSTFATQPCSYSKIGRQQSFEQKLYKTKMQFFSKKLNSNNRLILNNINGINLINYKPE